MRRSIANRIAIRLVLLWMTLAACSAETSAGEDDVAAQTEALRVADAQALARGTRETLVTGITGVENQMFSAEERLYVSADDGVFELTRTAGTGVLFANRLVHVDGCKFGGMSQRKGTLYALCYDGTQSYLYAAVESASPTFQRIFTLSDVLLANGMASDESNLYVTATGQGSIVKLVIDPSNPLRVTRGTFLDVTGGLLPNGIKIRGGDVYWGDFGTIHRTALANPWWIASPISALTFFDDFWVGDRVVLAADYLFGSVLAYTTAGTLIGGTPFGTFGNPSSVVEAEGRLGFGSRDLIVTEKGTGSLAVFHY
jgi:hypothetical protein